MKLLSVVCVIAIALFGLVGCAIPSMYQGMAPEQIAEIIKNKDASVNCLKGATVWTGQFTVVSVNLDKGVIPDGGITVDGDCKVGMTNNKVITTVTTVTTPLVPK